MESKAVVDEIVEFLTGKPIAINDIFHLGKFAQSSRPHPLLVKLSAIWDHKLLLSQRRNLREFRIRRLFLREDVPPESKLRQKDIKRPKRVTHDQEHLTDCQNVQSFVSPSTPSRVHRSLSPSLLNSPTDCSSTTSTAGTVVQGESNTV